MRKAEQTAREEAKQLPPELKLIYDEIVRRGNTPQMAMMFLAQRAPVMGQSDRQFTQSYNRHMRSMLSMNQEKIVEIAQKAGVNTHGKFYVGGLGRYTDQRAWCSTVEDVRTALKADPYLTAEGPGIKHTGRVAPPPPPCPMAPDIVKRETDREIAANPRLREKLKKGKLKRKDVEQKVIHKYGNRRALAAK